MRPSKRPTRSQSSVLAVANPERQGLVVSLARPGGNVTGMSNQFGGELSGKMFQLLKETVPKLSKVAIVWNPDNLGSSCHLPRRRGPGREGVGSRAGLP